MKLCRHSQSQYLLSESQQHLKPSNLIKSSSQSTLQKQLIVSVQQSNEKFIKYHTLNKDIVFLFSQMKLHELFQRLQKYESWVTKIKFTKQSFQFLLYNVYSESKMLYRMCEVNQMAYKNIKAIHVKAYEQQFGIQYCKMSDTKRIQRTMEELEKYFVRLENLYMITDKPLPKRLRSESYEQIAPNPLKQSISSYIFGLTNGFSFSLIILSIIIYSISQINSYSPRFSRDFPTWRAIIYVILHMWAFALSTIVFQKYKINYSLIFGGNNMKQRSSFALYIASFFTFVYMVLFVVYLLHLTGLIGIGSEVVYCFPAIIWGVILVCVLLPLPVLHYKGRLEFFKHILMTLLSPLFHVHFNVIFMTEQFISHILPFSDVVYTLCYYTHETIGDLNQAICENYLHSAEYFGILLFSYRLIQSLKVAYQNNAFLNTREMYICIRAALNIFIIVISLLSTIQRNLAIVWIVFAVPICFFNYYVDLKWDWGLLEIWGMRKVDNDHEENNNDKKVENNNDKDQSNQQKNLSKTPKRFLRNFITFQPMQYYFIMILNLTFRFISLLAISENIIYETKIKPLYLIFAIACIQIIRRLFWNILKVEREHVINCERFRVKKYYHENQENIRKQLKQRYDNNNNEQIKSEDSLQRIRKSEQIKNLQEQIERKVEMKEQIEKWRENQYQKIEEIERGIEDGYRKQQEERERKKKNK